MNRFVVSSSRCWRVLRWVGLAGAGASLWACTSRTLEMPTVVPSVQKQWSVIQKINNNLDLLFMIDNSSSMTTMQQKLLTQLPNFLSFLKKLPVKPNIHLAVVSSDMGAKSDVNVMCTPYGNQGEFFSQPEGACTTTLTAGATFISDVDGVANFTDPIASVFQCIGFLGATGCGFEQQLASIDRALGADGLGPPPSENAGFLRSDAYLGIVMLTNEDDCSAPADTTIFSLNGSPQSLANPDGPITNYRCNGGRRGGHLCKDVNPGSPNMGYATPPLNPPPDAIGTPSILQLTDCQDNDSGSSALTPVSKFISDIKALKPDDPDNQILVGEIIAPATPYAVEWASPKPPLGTTENWPQVMHSCGAAGGDDVNPDPSTQTVADGSYGDPGVRETEFANAFPHSVIGSICDVDYSGSMAEIAQKLGQFFTPPCIDSKLQNDAMGNPECSVIENLTDGSGNQTHLAIENCNENGNRPPCWTLEPGMNGCTGQSLKVNDSAANMMASSENSTISCALCVPGVAAPGC